MALRSPTSTHSYWGAYATVALPVSSDVEVGDIAFDITRGSLVVCTAIGPVVWSLSGSFPSSPISLSLDGTSAAAVSTYVGSVYVPSAVVLDASSRAFLGTSGTSETVTLQLLDPATASAVATFSASITGFSSVLVTGTPSVAAGWYDLLLTSGASSQAYARGLYLTA